MHDFRTSSQKWKCGSWPCLHRSKRKIYPGNRAGFSLPNQHFDQGLNLSESTQICMSSPTKEGWAAFGPPCAQHVGDLNCRDAETGLDTRMALQGLHSGKIHNCTNVVPTKEHPIFGGTFFFVFHSQRKNKSNKTSRILETSLHALNDKLHLWCICWIYENTYNLLFTLSVN